MTERTGETGTGPEGLVERIEAVLPQLQCRKCGFADCRDYAQAIHRGAARVNRCTPGGTFTVTALAELLGEAPLALDPGCPEHHPGRVVIDETECIGCARCLPACPVDAIVGAPRMLHSVRTGDCTGCGLCLAACPVDCIEWRASGPGAGPWPSWSLEQAAQARARYRPEGRETRRMAAFQLDRPQRRREIREAVARVQQQRREKGHWQPHRAPVK